MTSSQAPKLRWLEIRRQTKLLTSRYVTLLKSDKKNLGLMLGLAPVVAALMLLLNSMFNTSNQGQTEIMAFMLIMSVIIVGTFMSVREIVKESVKDQDLLRHERFAGLDYVSYYASKFVPLAVLSILSAVVMALILRFLGGPSAFSISASKLAVIGTTGLGAIALGLLISAIVDTSEKAFMLLAPVIILQLCLAGGITPVNGEGVEWMAKLFVLAYWPFEAIRTSGQPLGRAIFMETLHIIVYVLATLVLLIRKDGGALIPRLKREVLDLVPITRHASQHVE